MNVFKLFTFIGHRHIVWLPGNKPRDQLAVNSIVRLLIDAVTIVLSFNGLQGIVSEIIWGHILFPLPRQLPDPNSSGKTGLIVKAVEFLTCVQTQLACPRAEVSLEPLFLGNQSSLRAGYRFP